MGVGPIPRSKSREYARDVLELDGNAFDLFCAIIARVDSDYVSMANEPKDKTNSKLLSTVSADDTDGVKGLFDRLEQAPRKPKAKQQAQK